ncbi:hypothetical protein GCM10027299_42150 [Larkinella ripae]
MQNQEHNESEFSSPLAWIIKEMGLEKVLGENEEKRLADEKFIEEARERQRQFELRMQNPAPQPDPVPAEVTARWQQALAWQKTMEELNLLNDISDGWHRVRIATQDGSQCIDMEVIVTDNKVDWTFFDNHQEKCIYKSRQIHNGVCLIDETFFGSTSPALPTFSVLYVYFMFE